MSDTAKNDLVKIGYAGGNAVTVARGRTLRLTGESYPLFKAPDPASVGAPEDCLDFLKTLHLSLCPVFDIRLRKWMGRYFDALRARADAHAEELPKMAGLEPETAHLAWCYAAPRPLPLASFELDGKRFEAPVLVWLADGPCAIRFDDQAREDGPVREVVYGEKEIAADDAAFLEAMGGDVASFWRDVAAPRHPFVRGALSGLRG